MTLTPLQLSKPYGKVAAHISGSGAPVVLLHGVGMQSAAWAPQAAFLAATHRVIALDLPGHGGSEALGAGAALPDFVEWLAAALAALGLGPVNLAGHSMGALVAGGVAISHPHLVSRVALLNGVYRRDEAARAAVMARADDIAQGAFDLETPLARWFGDGDADQAARAQVSGWLSAVDQNGYATAYGAFARGDAIYVDRFGDISCPLLALTGSEDLNSTGEMAVAMATAAQNGKALVIEGHRHMVNLTAPDVVNAALERWLNSPINGGKMTEIDPRALRNAFGAFMTGVTVVTTHDKNGSPLGFTANSFSSVSLDPPLVMVCLANSSRNYEAFSEASGYAVNVLSEAQKEVSNTFASPIDDRFAAVSWQKGPFGSPVIDRVSAWFDCSMFNTVAAGDHLILIGKVEAFKNATHPGLGYARGAYVTPATEAKALGRGSHLVVSALIEYERKILLVRNDVGKLDVPQMDVGKEGLSETLLRLCKTLGVNAKPGFVYSVYEDESNEHQHISVLCQAKGETTEAGRFMALSQATLAEIADKAVRTMLERFAQESQVGSFGVYYGNQVSGKVRPLTKGS